MARMLSQLLLKLDEWKEEDNEDKEQEEDEEEEIDEIAERFKCMSLHWRENTRRGGKLYGQWRQEQRIQALRMKVHLSEKWAIDELIEEQLSRFDAHYSRAMGPCRLRDVAQLLVPKCRLPLEMASLAWLGNWRPSAILALLHSFSPSSSTSSDHHRSSKRVLSQLIRETRIEEAVLDEQMAEIQANCILHLPFFPANYNENHNSSYCTDLASVLSEFKKIDRVITQAQKLRYKTLELVVKKLLNRTQAAGFLVAFAGIQETVREFAACQKRQKGPVSVTVKAFGM